RSSTRCEGSAMSFGRNRPLGLRTRLSLWTSLVLATSLAVGFAWVHHGLRRVLDARNDAFLERKATELLATVKGQPVGGRAALDAEVRREVAAYEDESLVIIVREPGRLEVTPEEDLSRRLADQPATPGTPRTLRLSDAAPRFRVFATHPDDHGLSLTLAISLAETEATLAEFDRWVAGGSLAFLALAVAGGL